MDLPLQDEHPSPKASEPSRSERSVEFEAFWRSLPKGGLVPHRRDVRPSNAPTLLRDMVMLEARLGENPSLRLRLVGTSIQERIQTDITGTDSLDFRPPSQRMVTVEFVRLLLSRPCGFWQIMPIHYARGFSQKFEVTAFPLLGDDAPLVLGLMQPLGSLVQPIPFNGQPILTEPPSILEFIDIGAGKPPASIFRSST